MKKQIGIWIGVLAVCIALLGGIGAFLMKEQEQVTVIEEMSYGDRSAAEGLTVRAEMQYAYRMFWDIAYTLGDPDVTEIRSYDLEKLENITIGTPQPEIDNLIMTAASSHKEYTEEGIFPRVLYLDEMVADVTSRTAAGGTHEETLYYSDYMDYYPMLPIQAEFGDAYVKEGDSYVKLDQYEEYSPAFVKAWTEFFQMPVMEEDWVTISVTKDKDGKVIEETMEQSGMEPFEWGSMVETEDGWYIGLYHVYSKQGYSQMGDGNGIYFMPAETENGYRCAKPEKLTTVIPLPEDSRVTGLHITESKKNLYVAVSENGESLLKIYDLSTMEEIQVLDRGASGRLYVYDEFILMEANQLLWLYERNEAGLYELKFRVSPKVLHEKRYMGLPQNLANAGVIDYNGEYLLIAGWRFPENADLGVGEDGFYISLYDESGLVYCGLYKTSLDTGESREDVYYSCQPAGYYNFTVEWSE